MLQENINVDWKDASPTDSVVDIKNSEFELSFTGNSCWTMENPLGVEFDTADVWIDDFDARLNSSRFLHSWDRTEVEKFKGKQGVWLLATEDNLVLCEGVGDKNLVAKQPEWGLFFAFSSKNDYPIQGKIRLSVCCSN